MVIRSHQALKICVQFIRLTRLTRNAIRLSKHCPFKVQTMQKGKKSNRTEQKVLFGLDARAGSLLLVYMDALNIHGMTAFSVTETRKKIVPH